MLPYTFSYDLIGGPEVGWCSPADLCPLLPTRLSGDLTVEAAMAVSGAAFASANGHFYGPANLILALINARLGVWLPNPTYPVDEGRKWWQARPPKKRRISYLVREIMGWYAKDNPLLFVTDGARYDTLGLLELLRHRCNEIYCFDASSDTGTFASCLARSITLARDEMGVEVHLDEPENARPYTAAQNGGQPDLAGRLANRAVITGTLAYPELGPDLPASTGILVIGRAALEDSTPWDVRRHAASHPSLPQDATGDQWFDDTKFDAYTALGRHVGKEAIGAMEYCRDRKEQALTYPLDVWMKRLLKAP